MSIIGVSVCLLLLVIVGSVWVARDGSGDSRIRQGCEAAITQEGGYRGPDFGRAVEFCIVMNQEYGMNP
jgi:hypothetical protein